MKLLVFEWDDKKSAANEKKHGVSFDEAKEPLKNPFILPYSQQMSFEFFHP
jgi:uncharacterized DUF497 family protein